MLALLVAAPLAAAPTTMIGRFTPGSLAGWEHKSFKGETRYRLVGHGDRRALQATCHASASAIARRRTVDLSQTPILRWEWRVDHVYPGLRGTTRAGDDYPARVYVIHDGGVMLWRTRAVNYVWANSEPRGAHWPNAFTDKAMMVAVQSGQPADPGAWVAESRNVRADFKRFYDLDLRQIDGVAQGPVAVSYERRVGDRKSCSTRRETQRRGVPRPRLATLAGAICGPTRRDKRCFSAIQRCSTLVQNDCTARTTPRLAEKQRLARTRTKQQQALLTDCDNSGRSGRAEYRNIRFAAR
ncbi:MAG: DUF3047 domain-containing protein [Salinisphaera sp.]|uniref:DUF3047 domain-containing protein n=1 Tax=Salinisphaera sp. TaxID=1914330 RepID=UPI003C7E889C